MLLETEAINLSSWTFHCTKWFFRVDVDIESFHGCDYTTTSEERVSISQKTQRQWQLESEWEIAKTPNLSFVLGYELGGLVWDWATRDISHLLWNSYAYDFNIRLRSYWLRASAVVVRCCYAHPRTLTEYIQRSSNSQRRKSFSEYRRTVAQLEPSEEEFVSDMAQRYRYANMKDVRTDLWKGVCIKHGSKDTRRECNREGCTNYASSVGFVSWSRGSAVQMYYNLGAMDFVEVTGARSLDVWKWKQTRSILY
jgi:hypothetical protein